MLNLDPNTPPTSAISQVQTWKKKQKFIITQTNSTIPWGAYYLISDSCQDHFISSFFPNLNLQSQSSVSLSLKFLLVAPNSRLSWQFHHYRQEYWYVITGPVDISLSLSDIQPPSQTYQPNSNIQIPKGTRHRLIGTQTWGLVAEIWQHTDINHPSTESDIIRLQDDYQRQD